MRIKIPGIYGVCILAIWVLSRTEVQADLLVIPADNGYTAGVVLRFDERTGAFITSFGHNSEAFEGIQIGPDGKVYVASNTLGSVGLR